MVKNRFYYIYLFVHSLLIRLAPQKLSCKILCRSCAVLTGVVIIVTRDDCLQPILLRCLHVNYSKKGKEMIKINSQVDDITATKETLGR